MSIIPNYSDNSARSVGVFYREIQEIDIYVEDSFSEALYYKLISRAVNGDAKIKKIIPLNGRRQVENFCEEYSDDFPAIFIIDGDLDMLIGKRISNLKNMYQHKLYCLENYLFCPDAAAELIQDSCGRTLPNEAVEKLKWQEFLEDITEPLVELFKHYGIIWKIDPEIPTVSRKYHTFTIDLSKNQRNHLCRNKINQTITELKAIAIQKSDEDHYFALYEEVSHEIRELSSPLNAVSGKDYLLKAFSDHLRRLGVRNITADDSFKFRLARFCNIEPLMELAEAIVTVSKGGTYNQQH